MPRIGAEYQDPSEGDQATTVQHARLVFLSRIERVAPDVLTTLRDGVLPQFSSWRVAGAEPWYFMAACARWPSLHAMPQSEPLAAFTAALEAWAARWRLTDEWLKDDALSTLRTWHEFPQTLTYKPLHFHSTGWGGAVLELDMPPCLPFEPTMETWDAFAARVEEWTRQNRQSAQRLAKDHGLEAGPEKRGKDPALHFEWLVRYQCQGWTHERIATEYEAPSSPDGLRARSTVTKALKETAKLIGLTLR